MRWICPICTANTRCCCAIFNKIKLKDVHFKRALLSVLMTNLWCLFSTSNTLIARRSKRCPPALGQKVDTTYMLRDGKADHYLCKPRKVLLPRGEIYGRASITSCRVQAVYVILPLVDVRGEILYNMREMWYCAFERMHKLFPNNLFALWK